MNVTPGQRTAAKVVGVLYVVTMISSIVGFALRDPLLVSGDAAATAEKIAAAQQLYRISLVSDVLTVAGVLVLAVALYLVLEPVNRGIALTALAWRLAENFTLAFITLCGFAVSALLSGAEYLQAFDPKQLQALAYTLGVRVHGAGFNIGFVFLGLGSTTYSLLWLRSRYIPRGLALWGIVTSLFFAVVTIAKLVEPGLRTFGLAYMMPLGTYEVGLGIWLLVNGLRETEGGAAR